MILYLIFLSDLSQKLQFVIISKLYLLLFQLGNISGGALPKSYLLCVLESSLFKLTGALFHGSLQIQTGFAWNPGTQEMWATGASSPVLLFHMPEMNTWRKQEGSWGLWFKSVTLQPSTLQVPISTSGMNFLPHPATVSRLAPGSLCSHHWPLCNSFLLHSDRATVPPVMKPIYSIKINLTPPLSLLMSLII